jgi:L-lysine 2,3-aminomutase
MARPVVAPYYRFIANLAKPNRHRRTTCSTGSCLRHEFLASGYFTPAY